MRQIALPKISISKKILVPAIFAILLAAIISAGYFFFQYQKTQALLKNPSIASANELKELVGRVGSLIELPKEEDPTIATVSDRSKLADQPFFKNSENGDKVLIYTKSKKAILYRPSTNKIIEVAPVNIGEGQVEGEVAGASTSASASPNIAPSLTTTTNLSAVVLNGTSQAGLASSTKKDIEQEFSNVKVLRLGDTKGDFTETIVVDLKNNSSVAKSIADALGGKVGPLPEGESEPSDADFLIIVGE